MSEPHQGTIDDLMYLKRRVDCLSSVTREMLNELVQLKVFTKRQAGSYLKRLEEMQSNEH